MLEELGVPYQHVMAKPWSKQAKQYHPLGKIPALVDDDFVLYESAAINTYLGDKYQQLVPPPRTRERARYNQYCMFIMTEMDAQGLWIHRKHEALAKYFGACPQAVEEAKRQFDKVQAAIVSDFSGPYLLGSEFTAADILYVHCLDWAKSIGWFHDVEEGALVQYLDLCKSRPAYQRAAAKRRAEREQGDTPKSNL
jgi:glutathione S-transferase